MKFFLVLFIIIANIFFFLSHSQQVSNLYAYGNWQSILNITQGCSFLQPCMGWSVALVSAGFQGWFLMEFHTECKAHMLSHTLLPDHRTLSPCGKPTRKEQCQRKTPIFWLMKAALCLEPSQCTKLQNTAGFGALWIPGVAFPCNQSEKGFERLQNEFQCMAGPICPKTVWLKQDEIKEESYHQNELV